MQMQSKRFTVAEANETLPQIESIFKQLEAKKAALGHHVQKLHVLDALWGEAVNQPNNPDHDDFQQHRRRIGYLKEDILRIIEEDLLSLGVRFPQGGLEHGLIDFPTTFEGRWVLLCWKRGESEVGYWHEVDGGYARRQEILAEHVIGMGRDDAGEYPPEV
jgi:hypothetical protein